MCDYFNIQIDSPLSVLSQEASKKFLSDSPPRDKYDFFLQATQLARLADEYEKIKDDIRKIDDLISQRVEDIDAMQQAVAETDRRLLDAITAHDRQTELHSLKNELVWAFAAEKYQQLAEEKDEFSKLEELSKKYSGRIRIAQLEIDTVTEKSRVLETRSDTTANELTQLEDDLKVLRERIRKNKLKIVERIADREGPAQNILNVNKLIQHLRDIIHTEKLKLQSNNQETERGRRRNQLDEVIATLTEKRPESEALDNERNELETRHSSLQEELALAIEH